MECDVTLRIPIELQPILEDARASFPPLTRREAEILPLIAAGKSNKEIGNAVDLSERTVKFHVSSLLAKFKVQGRVDLARLTGNGNGTRVAAEKEQPTCP